MSGAGQRTVALPDQVIEELRDHLERFTARDDASYVFTSEDGQPIDRYNFRKRIWLPIASAAGLEDLRFHDLRHTAGTLAARTGATTKELMVRLGHSSPNASLVYQHASADRDQKIADGSTKLYRKAEGRAAEGRALDLMAEVGQGEAAGLARTRSEAESRSDPLPAVPRGTLTMERAAPSQWKRSAGCGRPGSAFRALTASLQDVHGPGHHK